MIVAGVRTQVFADQDLAGRLVDWAKDTLRTTIEIVRKPADQRGFNGISCRWVVERTLCAARRSVVSPVLVS
ncbi:hypothetical protein SAMN05216276_10678 [Streptosporangium subroseum]|uniref:Transposase n=1 Tax=Streptosporangium subroseum TaxID=106412 RepID=A0A239NRP8_9ACTN|nr:hypothetical protein [Streptosporangium subroseum]SNT57536.1 hypothetical protein SAMN05216276_10678 [Streptosporangium subroseum]